MAKIENPELLDAFRSLRRCEWCGKPVERCQPHHILAKGMGGGGQMDHRLNLIGLCALCHGLLQAGAQNKLACIAYVAGREGFAPEYVLNELYRLRRITTEEYQRGQGDAKD